MSLVGGFRNISVERSAFIGRCEEEQTKPLSQLNSSLNGMCRASEPVVTPDQFHHLTAMKLVTKDAGTTVILRQRHGNGCESLKRNFDTKFFSGRLVCVWRLCRRSSFFRNVGFNLQTCTVAKPKALYLRYNTHVRSVDKKNQLDVTFCILYFSSNSCSTCFGQPCAHHQELTTAWCYSLVLVCAVAAGRLSRPIGR